MVLPNNNETRHRTIKQWSYTLRWELTPWSDCEACMRQVSVRWPGVIFTIRGIGDNPDDQWVAFHRNGECQAQYRDSWQPAPFPWIHNTRNGDRESSGSVEPEYMVRVPPTPEIIRFLNTLPPKADGKQIVFNVTEDRYQRVPTDGDMRQAIDIQSEVLGPTILAGC